MSLTRLTEMRVPGVRPVDRGGPGPDETSPHARASPPCSCYACDYRVHAANKVAQRHRRSWLCEGCSPAGGRSATRVCQLDAARPDAWQLLCETCDHRNCTAQLCRLKELHQQQAARSARGPVAPLALGKRLMLKGLPPLDFHTFIELAME